MFYYLFKLIIGKCWEVIDLEKETKEDICNTIYKLLLEIDDDKILSIILAFIKGIL